MPFNPLAAVTDYPSMLNRIFWFTTASAVGAVWLLRSHVPSVDAALAQIDFAVAVEGGKALPTSAGYLLPALGVAILAHVFRLHARVSDWLRIRERFDLEVIIAELGRQLSINLEEVGDDRLRRARAGLMRKAFYPYVSGTPSAVDQQLVQQALDAWSWFWIGLVATLLFTLTGIGLIACGATEVGIQTLGGTIIFAVLGLAAMYGQCRRYAVAQVRAILADATRAAAVRGAFAEMTGERIERRMAA